MEDGELVAEEVKVLGELSDLGVVVIDLGWDLVDFVGESSNFLSEGLDFGFGLVFLLVESVSIVLEFLYSGDNSIIF